MGTVYQALDPEIDRLVAIKTFSGLDPDSPDVAEFRDRFVVEARAAGRLTHPGIVTIYDRGEEPESRTPYIVMEYVAGRPLSALLANQTVRLEEKFALEVGREIAEALAFAHEKGVVHRDIKPSNILITEEGRAKIADFGVARLDMSNTTLHGEVVGTPAYMSPEQLTGADVDGRTDIFSLGVILYTMLCGFRPFQGNGARTIGFKVINQQPMPITTYHLDLSKDTEYVVARSMAKNRDERYATGNFLAADLTDILEGREPRSRRESSIPVNPEVGRVVRNYRPFITTILPPEQLSPPSNGAAVAAAPARAPGSLASSALPVPSEAAPQPVSRPFPSLATIAACFLLAGVAAAWVVRTERTALRTADAGLGLPPIVAENLTAPPPPVRQPAPVAVILTSPTASVHDKKAAASTDDFTRTMRTPRATRTTALPPAPAVAAAVKPVPTPVWHDPLSAPQPATIELAVEHHFHEAQISIWVDDKLAFSGVSRGETHKRLFLHGSLEGKESKEIKFPPGDHEIKVRVVAADDSYDNSGIVHSTFLHDQRTTLQIHCNKHGLSLQLSGGS